MKLLGLLLLFTLSSCSVFDNEQSIENSEVLAVANAPIFSVLNKSERPIFIFVMESNDAALFDPAPGFPCAFSEPNLPSRENIQIQYSEILGWEQGEESVWFYWTDCNGSSDSQTIKL